MLKNKKYRTKLLKIAALFLAALLSMTVFSNLFSSPEFHNDTIEKLDEMKLRATELSTAITVASTLITTLNDDWGTPIAEQLAELSSVLLVCTCILFLEKYLLTSFVVLAFSILIPIACVISMIHIVNPKREYREWTAKILVLAIVLTCIVPCGVKLISLIEETFAETISHTFNPITELVEKFSKFSSENKDLLAILGGVKDTAAAIIETLQNILTILTDGVALLFVTTCIVPLMVAMFFALFIKRLFGVHFTLPDPRKVVPVKSIIQRYAENDTEA